MLENAEKACCGPWQTTFKRRVEDKPSESPFVEHIRNHSVLLFPRQGNIAKD